MATAVKVGKEGTHGTVSSAFTSVPCNFSSTYRQSNKVLEEDRQGQDRHFQVMKGQAYNEWEVADSGVYHDTVGFWLCSAMGMPTKTTVDTVFENVFKFADDPVSLSLQWQQPRRYTQAYQALYGVVDQFGISFSAEGDLMYSASGIAMAETEITTITHSWTTARPMPVWAGTVKLNNVAFAKLVSGSISVARNRKPFFVINNTQSPSAMNTALDGGPIRDPRCKPFAACPSLMKKGDPPQESRPLPFPPHVPGFHTPTRLATNGSEPRRPLPQRDYAVPSEVPYDNGAA